MIWRQSASFPAYEVSEHGDVRRIFRAGPSRAGRLLSGARCPLGRLRYHLRDAAGGRHQAMASRLVAECFITGDVSLFVCHRDGDVFNNHFSNLYYGTQVENMVDRERHGRTPRGELNGEAKVTALAVRAMRERFGAGGVTMRRLANEHGITATQVSAILHGRAWSTVGGPIFKTGPRGDWRTRTYERAA